MGMLVSIIIPVYKVEKYIEKCLTSIINQTYTEGVECLIIDDCSPDNSIAIAENIVKNYDGKVQFIIRRREENGGLSAARNIGISISRGFYLYFLDSDDWLKSDCLEQLIRIAHKYPLAEIIQGGAVVSVSKYAYLSMKGKVNLSEYSNNRRIIKTRMLDGVYPATVWNKLIKRKWLFENNLFFKEGLIHEDDYWNFFAAKSICSFAICKRDTYIYNIHSGSITQTPNRMNLESRLISLKEFLSHIDDFCISAQRRLIYRIAYSNYVLPDNDSCSLFRGKLRDLSLQCNLLGKFVIWLTLHLPYFIHQRSKVKYIFERGLSRLM